MAGLIFGGALATHAKGAPPLPTGAVDNLSIQLTVTTPGTITPPYHGVVVSNTVTSTINTKTIISAIGGGLGVTFSPAAQLLITNSLSYTTNSYTKTVGKKTTTTTVIIGTSGRAEVVVQDRAAITPAPGYFSFTNTSVAVTSSTTETNIQVTTEETTYSVATVSFSSPSLAFTLQGFDTAKVTYPRATSGIYVANTIHSVTSASGTVSLTPSGGTAKSGVCQGTITTTFSKLE